MKTKYLSAALLALITGTACADDWPQWQGPDRNAVSKEKGLLQEWPENGPPLAWRAEGLGGGDSIPAVADGRLFGMSIRDGKEIVWALSERDGKELWVSPLGDAVQQRVPQSKEGPACTPSVSGDRLFVIGMGGTIACLNTADGAIVWRRSFTDDFGGTVPAWSYRESPLVDGDRVICTPGGSDALIVALDKRDGKTIWKSRLHATSEQPAGNDAPRPVAQRPGQNEAERPGRPETSPRPPAGNDGAPQIEGTKDQALFLSERWGMTAFTWKLPTGKYRAMLYFA